MPDPRSPQEELIEQYDVRPEQGDVSPAPQSLPVGTPAPGATPAPAPAPKHPAYLVEEARELGLSDEDIAEMPSLALGTALRKLRSREREQYRQLLDHSRSVDQGRQQPAPEPEPDALDFGKDEFGEPLEKSLDPSIVRLLKQQQREIAELKKSLGDTRSHIQAREAQTQTEQIDAGFADLSDLKHVFGEGPGEAMKAGDKPLTRRRAVLMSLQNDPPRGGSLRDNVRKRAAELFGDLALAPQPAAPPPASPKPRAQRQDPRTGRFITQEEWDAAGLSAGHGGAPAQQPHGRDRAVTNLARHMQEQDTANGFADESEPEGLPD